MFVGIITMVFSYLVQKAGKGQNRIWGDRIVIDWKEEAEKTYGFQVDTLRRGTRILDPETDQGTAALKNIGKREPSGVRRGGFAVFRRNGDSEGRPVYEKFCGRAVVDGRGWNQIYREGMVADPECDLKDERSLVSGAGPGAPAPAVPQDRAAGGVE